MSAHGPLIINLALRWPFDHSSTVSVGLRFNEFLRSLLRFYFSHFLLLPVRLVVLNFLRRRLKQTPESAKIRRTAVLNQKNSEILSVQIRTEPLGLVEPTKSQFHSKQNGFMLSAACCSQSFVPKLVLSTFQESMFSTFLWSEVKSVRDGVMSARNLASVDQEYRGVRSAPAIPVVKRVS